MYLEWAYLSKRGNYVLAKGIPELYSEKDATSAYRGQ